MYYLFDIVFAVGLVVIVICAGNAIYHNCQYIKYCKAQLKALEQRTPHGTRRSG